MVEARISAFEGEPRPGRVSEAGKAMWVGR